MTLTTYKWSIDKYHQMIDSEILVGKSVELLDGEIVEISPEREEHSYTNDDVAELLREKFKGLAKIRESHPITLDNSEPEPDIAIVRLPKTIYAQRHPYPQDIYWLIEVRPRAAERRKTKGLHACTRTFEVSKRTLSKDLNEKSEIYARNDIPEYWILDLVNNKLTVQTNPQNNLYTQHNEYTEGEVSPLAFPNLKIALDRLLLF